MYSAQGGIRHYFCLSLLILLLFNLSFLLYYRKYPDYPTYKKEYKTLAHSRNKDIIVIILWSDLLHFPIFSTYCLILCTDLEVLQPETFRKTCTVQVLPAIVKVNSLEVQTWYNRTTTFFTLLWQLRCQMMNSPSFSLLTQGCKNSHK